MRLFRCAACSQFFKRDERRCPHCGAQAPGVKARSLVLGAVAATMLMQPEAEPAAADAGVTGPEPRYEMRPLYGVVTYSRCGGRRG